MMRTNMIVGAAPVKAKKSKGRKSGGDDRATRRKADRTSNKSSSILGGAPTVTTATDDDGYPPHPPGPHYIDDENNWVWVDEQSQKSNKGATWTSIDPASWDYLATQTKDAYGFSKISLFKKQANRAADLFYRREGRYPSAMELLNDPTYLKYLGVLQAGYNKLPVSFSVDGQVYFNDPYEGPKWVFPVGETYLGSLGREAGQPSNDGRASGRNEPSVTSDLSSLSNPLGVEYSGMAEPEYHWTMDEFVQVMDYVRTGRGPSGGGRRGGGGGGGGGGRVGAAWDRDQLAEAASDQWKALLLEEPTNIDAIVDDYIAKADAFWMGEGGHLDFNTFVLNKIRETGRYRQLYKRKPGHMTEADYIGGFVQTAERFGMNDSATLREEVAGAEAGVGLAGFAERVGKTREARMADGGGFSRRLASTFANMRGLVGS